MRRHTIVAGLLGCALVAISNPSSPIVMDPFGVGYIATPLVLNAAGPTVTPEQDSHSARAKHSAPLFAGIDLIGETAGSPARGVQAGAGATAEKDEASVWAKGSEPPRHRAPFFLFAIVADAAGRRGVPIHILAGLAEDESGWRVGAVSEDGATVGLLQLKQGTADWCGKVDRLDAVQNVDCGARYLYAQFETFGSWELALAAYKAGPARIPEDIPAEAWAYVQRTLVKAEAYR